MVAAGGVAAYSVLTGAAMSVYILNEVERDLIKGYAVQGFETVKPHTTWKADKQSLSLNQRM